MIRSIPLLILCLFVLSGCRDHLKIERNNNPQGYADSQVVGNWKVTAYNSDLPYDWDGNGSVETDIYSTWSACQKDNLYTFVGDKTGTFKLNCSATNPGTWLILNTSILVYTPTGMPSEAETFISMTSVEFKTARKVVATSGQELTLTKTWSRQ